ncbi:peptidase inhibitor I9 [Herbihabitans rhizosphaerae]|uniref:Peptidase inhibitor I9 n=1 Tax=Herbihabitans rhizosphaerae TaxID=1872711 RepID=A0A4Q7KEC3_9PSEU|nr:S8 family peptidase [Herbihabitans rhizosphaerae]RZS32182.1 peptidase inhibitor I9 [Herbihabitans rhizosphaerae]
MKSIRRRMLCLGAATATAFTVLGTGSAQAAVPGVYIVGLSGTGQTAETLAGRYGGDVRQVYSAALRGFSVSMSDEQARRLAADPGVEFVQRSTLVRGDGYGAGRAAGERPKPPSWGLDVIDGKRDGVYTYPNGGTGVTVYNLDTELNLDHVSFEGRATSGYDFVDDDANVNDCKASSDSGHGTFTGGVSSSEDYGVAKDDKIVGVKILSCQGSGSNEMVIAGIDWVVRNAAKPAVINASWGGPGNTAIDRAVSNAVRSGITFVATAGSSDSDACQFSPGRLPEVITVAATDDQLAETGPSNHGSCVDLYAPGANIVSTSNSDNQGSKIMSGTSPATAHVTGAAAIYLSAHPDATPQQVRDALVNNASDGWVLNPGPGSPNKFLNVSKLGE